MFAQTHALHDQNRHNMFATRINIFLTGATGYVGGSILTGLLQHPNRTHFHITTLVRGDEIRTHKLTSLGVTPLLGSNESYDIIEKAASESHVVFHFGDSSDDLSSTQAILAGLNKRIQSTGKAAIYIHTSGTGVILEDVRGHKGSTIVYNDLDPDHINRLPDKQPHRNVDIIVSDAGHVNPLLKTVIVIPPLIYGIGTGPFKHISSQLPAMIRAALKCGQAVVLGAGEATWDHVHIADLVDAYLLLFDQLLAAYGPDADIRVQPNQYLTTGREGYYFAENGRHAWYQLAEKIGEVLHKKGIARSSEVKSFAEDDPTDDVFSSTSWSWLASQANSKAERLRKLGWKPHRPTIFDSVEEHIDVLVNEASK